jgi:hypothetical protein
MAKRNYGQVKRQKEASRKARQQKKQERRQARAPELDAPASPSGSADPEGNPAP